MEERLRAFEKMLRDIQARYADTTDKMARLKRQGKEKTATYRQLMGTRLTDRNILAIYRVYGLLD